MQDIDIKEISTSPSYNEGDSIYDPSFVLGRSANAWQVFPISAFANYIDSIVQERSQGPNPEAVPVDE